MMVCEDFLTCKRMYTFGVIMTLWPEGICGYMDVGISLECDDVCTWI